MKLGGFLDLMEAKLRQNDDKGERGWEDEGQQQLLDKLCDEVEELMGALARVKQDPSAIISECVDVALFAYFIADNTHRAALELPDAPEEEE